VAGIAAALMLGVFGWWLLRPQEDIGGPSPVVTVPKNTPPGKTPPKTSPKPLPKTSPAPAVQDDEDRVAEAPKPRPSVPAKPETPASVDYHALAARYYRADDFLRETQGATGAAESPGYGQALDSYKSGKYADVEKLLKPALKSDPDALKTKELLAHSLYQRGQYAEALAYFRQLVGARDRSLAERSEWAMALTLLHQLPAQKALLDRTLDRIIAKPGHAFGAKARELKARLSS
jgi:predicted Zn-dependent protease